jgi:excisionase family DNA binding protein
MSDEDLRLDLLDVEQLCALLKVNKYWVYREVQNERLPHLRVGRQLRFFRHEIVEYLRNGPKESAAS